MFAAECAAFGLFPAVVRSSLSLLLTMQVGLRRSLVLILSFLFPPSSAAARRSGEC